MSCKMNRKFIYQFVDELLLILDLFEVDIALLANIG